MGLIVIREADIEWEAKSRCQQLRHSRVLLAGIQWLTALQSKAEKQRRWVPANSTRERRMQ
jgi:hypothetical protein